MTFTNDLYPRAFNSDYTVYRRGCASGASIGANATIVCGVTLNEVLHRRRRRGGPVERAGLHAGHRKSCDA